MKKPNPKDPLAAAIAALCIDGTATQFNRRLDDAITRLHAYRHVAQFARKAIHDCAFMRLHFMGIGMGTEDALLEWSAAQGA